MTKVKQPSDGKGSLRDIQLLVNKNQGLIDHHIKRVFPTLLNDDIEWQSPLDKDDYAEYRDNDFIKRVGLDPQEIKLGTFWPKGGPQWDALATTTSKRIILVEAKANIPEVVTPATGASPKSKDLIDKSLKETKDYLGLKNEVDWSGTFYQYTNRLAHLYFLRVKHKKPAYLINIYFIGDKDVNGPDTKSEWKCALQVMYTYLGLSRHKLSKYMADIFIDTDDLRK
ncbi:MAG: hypothetical protein D6813_06625 [Calditrichaeota bacterium]|nr:MAG: hypothetical protein D6813_06625 [Calditrichota bacterium]